MKKIKVSLVPGLGGGWVMEKLADSEYNEFLDYEVDEELYYQYLELQSVLREMNVELRKVYNSKDDV